MVFFFHGCGSEYRSKKGLVTSKNNARAFAYVRSIKCDMKCTESRPPEQFYDQKGRKKINMKKKCRKWTFLESVRLNIDEK